MKKLKKYRKCPALQPSPTERPALKDSFQQKVASAWNNFTTGEKYVQYRKKDPEIIQMHWLKVQAKSGGQCASYGPRLSHRRHNWLKVFPTLCRKCQLETDYIIGHSQTSSPKTEYSSTK